MSYLEKRTPPIYFDYCATTPVDPSVLDTMLPYFKEDFGNPASQHIYGWKAQMGVEQARNTISSYFNVQNKNLIFTSGASESNNTAIRGLIRFLKKQTKLNAKKSEKFHILTSPVEHPSVLKTIESLVEEEKNQVAYSLVPIDSSGRVHIESLPNYIRDETCLMSFMWVNNELGSINPIHELAEFAHRHKIYFHSDATQAVGKLITMDLQKTPVDLISFSGHKLYGPKGIGGLLLRSSDPCVEILPCQTGGGQEGGLRSGTLNVPGIVGMGKAIGLLSQNRQQERWKYVNQLRQFLISNLIKGIPALKVNGSDNETEQVPHILSITFPHEIPASWTGLAMSRSSACHSNSSSLSPVLAAIGLNALQIKNTLRISISHLTTQSEIETLLKLIQ